ncbi:MAG TPA: DinB family protein [Candidatus Limnocylindria bacterium]|nr:DinB family protein [Candidatus Limnocylindria bacterium]
MSDEGEHAPRSVGATLRRVDDAWQGFRRALADFPVEHLDQHIGEGWTRKQMLAHIAAWHELTVERLAAFARSGEMQPLAIPEDDMNARVARSAEGRTAGEVLAAADGSFRRVRQQIGYLSDEQLAAHDGWPAAVIAGNTYGHYAEHLRDLDWR